jgi:Ca-activated chloride channel family protein
MKENKMTKLLNFICVMSLVFICSSAFADEKATEAKTKTIMILDASGSMWGQVDGKNKIVIARDVIKDLVGDWKKENHLGLITYGHRKKGDCQDIEQLIPVGEVDSAAFIKKVNDLNPKGKTPLTASIQKAAEILKYEEEAATIILVTDGLETCDANPCAVSESLEKKGIHFTAHVVAFDLTEDEKQTLKCIADNTGGMFLSASNAGELQKALKSVAKVAAVVPPSVRLHTVMKEGSEPILQDPLYYYIYDKDGQEVEATNANEPLAYLPPGQYTVKVRHNITTIEDSFTILEEGLLDHTIVIGTGHLKLSATQTQNGDIVKNGPQYTIYNLKEDGTENQKVDFNNNAISEFSLKRGKYKVYVTWGDAVGVWADTEVKADETTELTVNLNVGTLSLSSTKSGQLIKDGTQWYIYNIDENGERSSREISFNNNAKSSFKLIEGDYIIRASNYAGKIDKYQKASVTAGIETTLIVAIDKE